MRTPATLKASPEDFVVDEIPAYDPSGEGEHMFVRIRKRLKTTDEAVRILAQKWAIEPREVGVAGLKDRVGVTTQWLSVPARAYEAAVDAGVGSKLDGIEILVAKRHNNKLKTGHVQGNRFDIVVRDVPADRLDEVKAALARVPAEGVPNAFGGQRFGREGDTADQARRWLTGQARAPGNPRVRRFHFSALQSAAFNAVLEARVADGTWRVPLEGDLLKKESGGMFLCTDPETDRARAARGEVCPTGPILGDKMRQAEGAVRELEERVCSPFFEGIDLRRARSLGEGTRRALRLDVHDWSFVELTDDVGAGEQRRALRVCFVLPKGAYATTVLESVFDFASVSGSPVGAGDEGEQSGAEGAGEGSGDGAEEE